LYKKRKTINKREIKDSKNLDFKRFKYDKKNYRRLAVI
jgi:hypothetical protein